MSLSRDSLRLTRPDTFLVPLEVNHEPFLTLGIHIGAPTSIVATDLFGRPLDAVETPTRAVT